MDYNDEKLPTITIIEEMAKAYNFSLKERGFVFVNLEEEGKSLLIEEILTLLFKLRASYRAMGGFLDSTSMLTLTEKHIDKLRYLFNNEQNKGYLVTTNKTKCFLNSIALENMLLMKLLLLSQKCDYGNEIISIMIERTKFISENLVVESIFSSKTT